MKKYFYALITFFNLLIYASVIIAFIQSDRIMRLPLYLTMINFTCCSFYFLAKFIKHIKSSNHNFFYFLENILCKFFFTTALSVCCGYWLLSLGGTSFMPMSHTWAGFIINLYIHGFIGIIMLLEVLLHKREHHEHLYYKHLVIVLVIAILYFTMITIFAEFANVAVYPFLELNMKIRIGVFIVLTMLSFNSYQLYHFIVKRRFKEYEKDKVQLI